MKLLKILSSVIIIIEGLTQLGQADVSLKPIIQGLSRPVYIADPNDGTGRLFIVEKEGKIKIFVNRALRSNPFLNLGNIIATDSEQGLLGLAFDPQFKKNRRFFVCYTRKGDGAVIVSSFLASRTNRNVADSRSERIRLKFSHPFENHNGGNLIFGPDKLLYIGSGDGGGGGDPFGNGQKLNTLLGKILRIDVSKDRGYSVPRNNPFRGQRGKRGEIFAYGLRNPWRFSFDRATKRLYVGDVGQGQFEEVNIVRAGDNLGWNIREGNSCFEPSTGCSSSGLRAPIATYDHSEGNAITGGYVYRGKKKPELIGKYIFGDFGAGTIWTLTRKSNGAWKRELLIQTEALISSFGEDRTGELYVVDFNGTILKMQ